MYTVQLICKYMMTKGERKIKDQENIIECCTNAKPHFIACPPVKGVALLKGPFQIYCLKFCNLPFYWQIHQRNWFNMFYLWDVLPSMHRMV